LDHPDWIIESLLGHSSVDMLLFTGVPIAGYHTIQRDNSDADFTRKIKQLEAFLKIYPLLIGRYTDKLQDPDKNSVKKSKVKKPVNRGN